MISDLNVRDLTVLAIHGDDASRALRDWLAHNLTMRQIGCKPDPVVVRGFIDRVVDLQSQLRRNHGLVVAGWRASKSAYD